MPKGKCLTQAQVLSDLSMQLLQPYLLLPPPMQTVHVPCAFPTWSHSPGMLFTVCSSCCHFALRMEILHTLQVFPQMTPSMGSPPGTRTGATFPRVSSAKSRRTSNTHLPASAMCKISGMKQCMGQMQSHFHGALYSQFILYCHSFIAILFGSLRQ